MKNEEMVVDLVLENYISSERVVEAMKRVDRANFVPSDLKHAAYEDTPLPIGSGQTISAPSMVAIMTEKLDVNPGQTVLEVGTGSGYQAAILSELVGKDGKVFSIEKLEEVASFAKNNLKNYKNVEVVVGDGTLGYEKGGPYDRIIVTAAAPKVPQPLVDQLKKGGILAIPVGDWFMQEFILVKKNDEVKEEFVCGCVFVPLIGEEGFQEGEI